ARVQKPTTGFRGVSTQEGCVTLILCPGYRARYKYYPNMQFYVNDGKSISIVPGDDFDLIACFDSMVHMAGSVIEKYIASFVHKLKAGGIVWLDHSGKGVSEAGCRSDMTKEKMAAIAEANGFFVSAQSFRSPTDCISVLIKQ
ncbi:class I SAM-dependent methyltransferase, partial [Geobacter anodireducens]